MNNPSPLIPQGSLLEQKNKSRAKVKVAFFCVVGVHIAAILAALLAQGCKREQTPQPEPTPAITPAPVTETNLPVIETNPPTQTYVPSNPPTQTLPPETTPIPPTTATQEYVIQKGDTFSSLAPRFHVTVKALQDANPTVNPAKLQIKQKIVIPPPTAPTASSTAPGTSPATPAADAGGQTYTVKPGDNLTKIAHEFRTTPAALRKANKLKTDKIKVGDKLTVPAKVAPAPAAESTPPAAAAAPTSTAPAPTAPPQ